MLNCSTLEAASCQHEKIHVEQSLYQLQILRQIGIAYQPKYKHKPKYKRKIQKQTQKHTQREIGGLYTHTDKTTTKQEILILNI